MKSVRNSYAMLSLLTGIVAGSLLLGGLAEWKNSGIGVGVRFAGYVQNWGAVVFVFKIVGAVGVMLLGWYWLKLAGGITSIARLLKADKRPRTKAGGNAIINELGEAINDRLDSCANRIAELEKQIKDLQIQIQLTRRQKRNIEAIIYSIRDAVIVVDESDGLLMANEAAGKLFNFDFRGSQHKPIAELIGADNNELVDFLRQSRRSKVRATRREIKIADSGQRIADSKKLNAKRHTLNTKERILDCIVSCVYEEIADSNSVEQIGKEKLNAKRYPLNAKCCGVVAVLHDITREKEISQMKNDFVNHVSHELKTPLASITAYSEMLLDGEANNEQTRKEFCSVIQSQAKRLNRLIEEMLNTSRIESGLMKVEKGAISLTILIEEQLQMIKRYAEEKNIEVIRQNPIVFDQVYVDKDMISQVIVNLLGNAVKYTASGGLIKIETEVDENAGTARVSITDTGVGIPENEIEHIFDKFYRVGTNESCAEGTGLGLNLVKQIVEEVHNGRVFVSSTPGAGSTFGFELPLATEIAYSV